MISDECFERIMLNAPGQCKVSVIFRNYRGGWRAKLFNHFDQTSNMDLGEIANLDMKHIEVDGRPAVYLVTKRDVGIKEQSFFNYGDRTGGMRFKPHVAKGFRGCGFALWVSSSLVSRESHKGSGLPLI